MSIAKRMISLILVLILVAGLIPAVHAADQAQITGCVIDPNNKEKVSVSVQAPAGTNAEDGKLYLFAVPVYAEGISGYEPIAEMPFASGGNIVFSVDLNNNTEASLLYSKFYVAVKTAGTFCAITDAHYITNPELISASQAPRIRTASKKGIHMTMSIPTELEEMGIRHAFFPIVFKDFISNTETDISYTYNGKTYYFTNVVKDYDNLIYHLTRAGMAVTVALHNQYMAGYEYLIHPDAQQRAGTTNYAINTSNQQGLEAFVAATHFLAERYNGSNSAYGQVDNWIVGNEVNDNLQYYYMGEKELDEFVQEYLRSFRVLYTAIKSGYGNANVYICLQNRWNVGNSTGDYSGKDFLDKFSAYARAQGDIDWGLSYHPYSFPANDPEILNDMAPTLDGSNNATFGVEVTNDLSTPIITMLNLSLLTDYFHTPQLLNPDGQVRSIILGEQGYTSFSNIYGHNEARQSANVALSYYIAEMNKDVDAYLLRALTDEDEGNQYYMFGLREQGADGYPAEAKHAWEMYKYIDTEDSLEYTEFAKAALNITDWSGVVKNWNPSVFSNMGSRVEENLYSVTGCTAAVNITGPMLNQWETGYNVFSLSEYDYAPAYRPDGVAVANPYAYYMDYQGVEKHFDTPLNLSSCDYLCMDVCFTPMDASGASDRLELQVRLRSGNDTYDATGIIDAGKAYTLCLDLSGWDGRSAIDSIEVLDREYGQRKSFSGTFTVYHVRGASSVSGQLPLETVNKELTDLSAAELSYQKYYNYSGAAHQPEVTVKLSGKTLVQHEDFDVIYHNNVNAGEATVVVVGIGDYTGYASGTFTIEGAYPTVYNGIDYAPVYAYGYYKENNPMVVAEVGDDPEALLEHFVTKGMDYALQGIGSFNVLAYAQINGDLGPEFGDDWAAYYMHYLVHGIAEGRPITGVKPEGMEAPVYPAPPCINPDGSVVHTYSHQYDYKCDLCGAERVVNMTRDMMDMYRMYNPNTGEHFYTGSEVERDNLIGHGWQYEGIGFTFPLATGKPVHRLFEPSTGEHLYTMDEAEKAKLMAEGWNYEGIAFNSGFENEVPQYRLHNPNATVGAYHFTASIEERDVLIAAGWEDQGIGWYSMGA